MRIENDFYRLELDPQNGGVRSLFDKVGKLELIAEPRLAEAFRLLLPLPDLEANYITSAEQRVTSIEPVPNGAKLRWGGPMKNAQGRFDLGVMVYIEFVDKSIQFRIVVNNRTEHKLAEVWHGGLGGIMGVGDRMGTKTIFPCAGWSAFENLFQDFPESMGVGGGGGMRFPEFFLRYPSALSMQWMDMYNVSLNRGIYYACHDEVPRMSVLRFEMHPGIARNRPGGNWPSDGEMAAISEKYPAGLVMHWVHLSYTPAGGAFEGPPVVLQSHDGDWHRAARIYRDWFISQFSVRQPNESWLRGQQAVQDAMFLLPEGNIMMTFKDIPQWAKDAREHGVKTVMISGWNVGGHDNQYPNYTPDPRLGTWQGLAEAVGACHEMGIKVLFFANVYQADCSTDWYREELHKYRMMDAKGQSPIVGWGMGTLGARMGYTRPALTYCDAAFPEFRKIILEQMQKLAEIGADGIHFDKLLPGMDFNPALQLGPDEACFRGTIQFMEEVLKACREVNPDFNLGVEAVWDRLLEYADAWWFWHDMPDHTAVLKYTFPEILPTLAVVQPWDYSNVNNAIRYGYQILVGPVRYSASMQDEQSRAISAYIREVIRIREELKDTIFLGEFLDTLEASVDAPSEIKYNTHRNPRTGKRACVLVNQGKGPAEATVAFLGGSGGNVKIYRPFREVEYRKSPATVSIPSERLAIVVEE